MKDSILALMQKELTEKVTFLEKARIHALIEKFQCSELSHDEKREITDHILANYLTEKDDGQIEDMIDWLLRDVQR